MPKQLPTQFSQLIPPNNAYKYFEAAATRPFDRGADFSEVNAWWCAEASMLAYSSVEFTKAAMPRDWTYDPIPCAPQGSTQAFAMWSNGARIIAFRGTELRPIQAVVKDVLTDVEFLPVSADGIEIGAFVHGGFKKQFDCVADLVAAQVDAAAAEQQKVWFTGHSLGGALAFLAGARHPNATVKGIYTYGMPRVGNLQLSQNPGVYGKLHRVVHANDGVPSLPPGYVHVAEPHRIDRAGGWAAPSTSFSGLPGFLSAALLQGTSLIDILVQQMKAMGPQGELALLPPGQARFLTDHAPIYYATHLYNMVE